MRFSAAIDAVDRHDPPPGPDGAENALGQVTHELPHAPILLEMNVQQRAKRNPSPDAGRYCLTGSVGNYCLVTCGLRIYRLSITTVIDKDVGMSISSSESSRPAGGRMAVSRSTRADLVATLGVGVVAAAYVLTVLVLRLIEILGGTGITVPVQFAPVETLVPGPDSGAPVSIDEGLVVVSDLPIATFISVLLAEVLPAVAALIVIGCAVVVFRRLWHGEAFAPGTARLVTISSFAILGGWVASFVFGTMASIGALTVALGANAPDDGSWLFAAHVDWLPFLASMALGGLAILTRNGEKLRADTEGLI